MSAPTIDLATLEELKGKVKKDLEADFAISKSTESSDTRAIMCWSKVCMPYCSRPSAMNSLI